MHVNRQSVRDYLHSTTHEENWQTVRAAFDSDKKLEYGRFADFSMLETFPTNDTFQQTLS
jgi:hypothetical protein